MERLSTGNGRLDEVLGGGLVLNAITRAALGTQEGCVGLVKDEESSTATTTVLRIEP